MVAVDREAYPRFAVLKKLTRPQKIKTLAGRPLSVFAEVQEIEIESVASTTFRREDLNRGLEADESYYIQHAAAIRAKEEIDLSIRRRTW